MKQEQHRAGTVLVNAANRIPERKTTEERFQWCVCEDPVPLKPEHNVECSKTTIDRAQYIDHGLELKWPSESGGASPVELARYKSICEKWENKVRFRREFCNK